MRVTTCNISQQSQHLRYNALEGNAINVLVGKDFISVSVWIKHKLNNLFFLPIDKAEIHDLSHY